MILLLNLALDGLLVRFLGRLQPDFLQQEIVALSVAAVAGRGQQWVLYYRRELESASLYVIIDFNDVLRLLRRPFLVGL